MAVWKATGRKPAPLAEQGECPAGWYPIWEAFARLSAARQHGFAGMQPITHESVAAFVALSGVRLKAWQVEAIEWLDNQFLSQQAK